MTQQIAIWSILASTLALFIWGRWRYDLVALMALFASVALGLVEPSEAFMGFGEPAVITVALVLIVGKGLINSGLVRAISLPLAQFADRPLLQLAGFTILITAISGFMNNIGALAIIMPIAMTACRQGKTSPSLLMMPLAFGSLLGGMTTMIGTPPNIILSNYREMVTGEPFQLFDFSPVGLGVAVSGIGFMLLIGWRLIPHRTGQASPEEMYEVANYLTEIFIPKRSKMAGKTLEEFEEVAEGEVSVLAIIRGGRRLRSTSSRRKLKGGDILMIEADSEMLEKLLHATDTELVKHSSKEDSTTADDDEMMLEAVVPPNSRSVGKTPSSLRLRHRFDVTVAAIARQGRRVKERYRNIKLRQGDVLLLKGNSADLAEAVGALDCFPLADRGLRLERSRFLSGGLPLVIGVGAAALGILPIHISFLLVALSMILMRLVTLREAYESIDWAIIVLLGTLIPVGKAFDSTGAADTVAKGVLSLSSIGSPALMLGVVLVGTMFLSDIINNAAAAILMAPIAVRVATGLDASIDPFLMSVAIGASCAFLTPIGHQSSAMVMGPGGYRFGDYWRLGLPLEIVIAVVSIPLLQYFWPL